MQKVLFVCVHNSGRSQMAEAFYNHYAAGEAEALSAGTQPASHVDRTVVKAMREIGVDISSKRAKALTSEMLDGADRIITMGCGVEGVCPAVFLPTEDWQLEDPEGRPIEKVREIRDEIEAKIKRLIRENVTKIEVKNVETAV
ncbi:MAG: arsenate reductase ArsC [Dehalococcoidia bacterium]|nr:arsenate reductase ArsC [Dehalococcoidia bacterium]